MDTTYGVPVDELVAVIKNAIKHANVSRTDADRDLQVTSVYLKLNVIATIAAGGSLEFRIPVLGMKLKIGGTVTRQDTHTLEMTLIPEDLPEEYEVREGDMENILVEAIETLRAVMARAAEGEDPFVLKNSNVELAFAVTENGVISLGIEGELKDELTHTIRLGLAVPIT